MICTYCQMPVDPKAAWKGASHAFYCSEFCADTETTTETAKLTPDRRSLQKDQIDRQYLERLKRLLPYIRRSTHPAQSVS
jgi:hypothetical protein